MSSDKWENRPIDVIEDVLLSPFHWHVYELHNVPDEARSRMGMLESRTADVEETMWNGLRSKRRE